MVAPSSDIHINAKFPGKDKGYVIEKSVEAIEYAKERGLIVEFGAEDASRADLDFVIQLFKKLRRPKRTGLPSLTQWECFPPKKWRR